MANTATAQVGTTTFVYVVEGEPYAGTVSDYAKALEHGHYAGLDVSSQVWTFTTHGEPFPCKVLNLCTGLNSDDYFLGQVSVDFGGGVVETATYRIDGRA
jgi:hypothetical protein